MANRFELSPRQRRNLLTPRQRQRRGMGRPPSVEQQDREDQERKIRIESTREIIKEKKDVALRQSIKPQQFKDTGVFVKNEPDKIIITIPKNRIEKLSRFELASFLSILTSPVFIEKQNKQAPEYTIPLKRRGKQLEIGVFMKNTPFYSGGRYYAVSMSRMLARIGCNVTVVTDLVPKFYRDFDWVNDNDTAKNIKFYTDIDRSIWCAKWEKNPFDVVVGVPNREGYQGYLYAKKWNIPCWMMIFETPNYVSEFRGGLDSGEGYWEEYKDALGQCDKVICLAEYPKIKAMEWLKNYNIPKERFEVLNPYINTNAADQLKDVEEKHEIVFVGRHVDFKYPQHLFDVVMNMKLANKPRINFVGNISDKKLTVMQDYAENNHIEAVFHRTVNDLEKFRIIKRSKVVVIPSCFEGFGVVPAEAFCCRKPVVAYDIPVLQEVYGDIIDYAPIKNKEMLAEKVEKLLIDDNYRIQRGENGYNMVAGLYSPGVAEARLKKMFLGQERKEVFVEPTKEEGVEGWLDISAGMICLNSEDTIELSLRSIYPSVKEILIVEGAVIDYAKNNAEMVSPNGGSVDRTIDIIKSFPDPEKKIKILAKDRLYDNKHEMQNIIAEHITGDIYLKVDSDEIYKSEDIERIRKEFVADPELTMFKYKFNHFWHDLSHIAVGGQWESKMVRCWRWNKAFRHKDVKNKAGFNYYVDAEDDKVDAPKYKVKQTEDRLVYHLNYALQKPEKIRAKINYYKNRGLERDVADRWTDWKPGQPSSPTHPNNTGVIEFSGELPVVLTGGTPEAIEKPKPVEKPKTTEPCLANGYLLTKPEQVNVSVGMIVINEAQFLADCIKSIMAWKAVKQLIIVEGADKRYPKDSVTVSGLSKDRTGKIIASAREKYGKRIEYVQHGFAENKMELRNEYLKRVTGTHLFVLDADEFYLKKELEELQDILLNDDKHVQFAFKRETSGSQQLGNIVHFWHDTKHRAVGGYFSIPHQRIYRFVKGMRYVDSHNHPTMPDGLRADALREHKLWKQIETVCYHVGFCKKKKSMREKLAYYEKRGEGVTHTSQLDQKLKWENWEKGDKELGNGAKILEYNGFVPVCLRKI